MRIWPLYFFCVGFGFLVFPYLKSAFGSAPPSETANVLAYLSFTGNFDIIRNGPPDAAVLGVLWSVAVEEQFYFVWPLLMSLVPPNRYPLLFGGVIVTGIFFHAATNSSTVSEFHTLSCIGDMAIGGFAAFLMSQDSWVRRVESLSPAVIAGGYGILGFIYFFRQSLWAAVVPQAIERSLVALIFAFIIIEQIYAKGSLFKVSRIPLVSQLGKVSYGLYCLHFVGISAAMIIAKALSINSRPWQVVLLEPALALTLTIALSVFSYVYYESFFLKLKEQFSYITK